MIGGFSYYEICLYFIEYSFLGWVLEVLFQAVTKGKIVNRGFLNGPVCPIYGFGAIGTLMLSNALDSVGDQLSASAAGMNNLALFFGGMVIATLIELIGGWLLDKMFHTRWWNYTGMPFNFKGYICLEFSILWGLAILFSVRIVQPLMIDSTGVLIPENIGWPILAVLYSLFLADLIVTVLTIRGLNRRLAELDKIRETMRKPSDVISETIAVPAIVTSQHVTEQKVQSALAKAELNDKVSSMASEVREKIAMSDAERAAKMDELQQKKQQLMDTILNGKHTYGVKRLMKAFPQLDHHKYHDAMQELKEQLKK